ncbi:hypothetical protein [Calothrix sp. NIES-2100]|uniref:hypothetical protein n=1 Tax=Calothrix sp. NIES-2100 TaxID=1954172 RepID=UPI0030DA268B
MKLDASNHATLTVQRVEFERLVEELSQLKQCIRKYDRLFQQLGLNKNHISQQLGA